MWDALIPKFGVKITPAGSKIFIVRYRTEAGASRKYTIGPTNAIGLEPARDIARQVLAAAAAGQDPSRDRTMTRDAPSMIDLRDRYLEEHADPHKKASSAKNDRILWKKHIIPRFGNRRVGEITRADILEMQSAMFAKHHTANRVVALLSKAFNLSEVWGWRTPGSNPCRHVKKYPEDGRDRMLNPEELGRLGQALLQLEAQRIDPPSFVPLIRLLLFTGCRRSEISNAQWSWVDFENSLLMLPDSKTGRKIVQLSEAAMEIIRELPREKGAIYILPGRIKGQPIKSPRAAWESLITMAELPDLRVHDLRHTVGSIGHRIGLSQKLIAGMLGHKQMATTERYLHTYDSDRKDATDRTAKQISEWMGEK
ncbi:MAG: hypothetical protein A2018_01250 [Alphaproteobacteria bacterium GWF2_58_20]|nr:MAG: hypothetical protein A2018_01250 [Alphaproteobacteria bacterium GWF2_58_20]